MAASRCSGSHGGRLLLWLLLACSWVATERGQQTARTGPAEVAALNTILGRWGLKASSTRNISSEPCSGVAIDTTDVDNNPNINPAIKCDCTYNNATVCHNTKLSQMTKTIVMDMPYAGNYHADRYSSTCCSKVGYGGVPVATHEH